MRRPLPPRAQRTGKLALPHHYTEKPDSDSSEDWQMIHMLLWNGCFRPLAGNKTRPSLPTRTFSRPWSMLPIAF